MSPDPDDVPQHDEMPALGLGTWQNDEHDQCVESVQTALEMGYRHIDTAQIYGNERAVGEGIESATVPREDIFLATKVWIDSLSYEDALETTAESLEKLGTDYVDLLYVHWPSREYDPAETARALDELYDDGRTLNIGVSNFEPRHIDEIRDHLDAPLFANQVELHPYLPQTELREYATETDLNVVAYSPLARGGVLDDDTLSEIAQRHDASPPQVALAWHRAHGITAIPKATSEAHIRDNWQSIDLELTADEIETIDSTDHHERLLNPDFGPSWST
jgi:diketogulonate reductase-like aldo/keto reductase